MSGISLFKHVEWHARILLQRRLRSMDFVAPLVDGKAGLEIGGPSNVFREHSGRLSKRILPIYDRVGSLDNRDFSSDTVWATHRDRYSFSDSNAPDKNIFCDASDLAAVADQTHDFILSSDNLEHFANILPGAGTFSSGRPKVVYEYANALVHC